MIMRINQPEHEFKFAELVIRMAELAIEGKDIQGLSEQMVHGITILQHPAVIVDGSINS